MHFGYGIQAVAFRAPAGFRGFAFVHSRTEPGLIKLVVRTAGVAKDLPSALKDVEGAAMRAVERLDN